MMKETIEFFKILNNVYWGNCLFQGLFYLSVVVILTIERKQSKKILYGLYPLVLLVTIFNPLTVKVTRWFFSESSLLAYYMRWFSFLPMMCLIAMSITMLIDRLTGVKKMLLVFCVTVFIIVGGNNIYSLDWMQPATNAAKVPDDALQVCTLLHEDDKAVMVAVPSGISGYIRQLDATFYTPYGRYWAWDDLLMSPCPDAEAILTRAGEVGCDYVVVDKSELMKCAFNERGMNEIGETRSYLVYPVKGVQKIQKVYNDLRQVIAITYIDIDDKPMSSDKGYAMVRYEYDVKGRVFREFYFDEYENLKEQILGNYGLQREYDEDGNLWKMTYLAADGTPYVIADGYATIVTERCEQGNVLLEYYLGAKGEPVKCRNAWYGIRKEYDGTNVVRICYLDENGQTQMNNSGYAILTYAYDEDGHVIETKNYDSENMPVICRYGYHGIRYVYDENGYCIGAEYINLSDKVITISNGIARIFYDRDEHGNNILEWYEDEYGDSVSINGYYKIRRAYDENNAVIETIYLDKDGNPVDKN